MIAQLAHIEQFIGQLLRIAERDLEVAASSGETRAGVEHLLWVVVHEDEFIATVFESSGVPLQELREKLSERVEAGESIHDPRFTRAAEMIFERVLRSDMLSGEANLILLFELLDSTLAIKTILEDMKVDTKSMLDCLIVELTNRDILLHRHFRAVC